MELPKAIVPIGLAIATISILLALTIENKVYAWHEQLGISGERAAELLSSNPNDPAITEWKLQLQAQKDETIFSCFDYKVSPTIPAGNDGKITKEQKKAHNNLVQSNKQSCLFMMDILVKQCVSHFAMQPIACADTRIEDELVKRCATRDITDPIVCEDPRLEQKVKQKTIKDQIELQAKEDRRAILFCTQYIHADVQPESCQDPEMKQKVQIEAQKDTAVNKIREQSFGEQFGYTTTGKDNDDDKNDKKKDNKNKNEDDDEDDEDN
jgi:hypothetical protein